MGMIFALDHHDKVTLANIIKAGKPYFSHIKLGHIAFSTFDAKTLNVLCDNVEIMIDFKFYDIPSTIERALEGYAKVINKLRFYTISSFCQDDAIRAALNATSAIPFVVVYLTSLDPKDADQTLKQTERLIKLGCTHFICPPFLINTFRTFFGNDITLAIPGIRKSESFHDHTKPFTPAFAKESGADYIIVGRPILEAKNYQALITEYHDEFVCL